VVYGHGDTVRKAPVIPLGTSVPAIEMIEAILAFPELVAQYEGRRGTLYIDYAPGKVKIRVDKLGAEPVIRTTLAK
jgi:hypothetical protein